MKKIRQDYGWVLSLANITHGTIALFFVSLFESTLFTILLKDGFFISKGIF